MRLITGKAAGQVKGRKCATSKQCYSLTSEHHKWLLNQSLECNHEQDAVNLSDQREGYLWSRESLSTAKDIWLGRVLLHKYCKCIPNASDTVMKMILSSL